MLTGPGIWTCAGAVVVEGQLQQRAQGRRQRLGAVHRSARAFEAPCSLRSRASADAVEVGAGLLIKSFANLERASIRVSIPRVSCALTSACLARAYPERTQAAVFYKQLLDRVAALPGVQSAGAVSRLATQRRRHRQRLRYRGPPANRARSSSVAWYSSVTPDYFGAMGIRLLRGAR